MLELYKHPNVLGPHVIAGQFLDRFGALYIESSLRRGIQLPPKFALEPARSDLEEPCQQRRLVMDISRKNCPIVDSSKVHQNVTVIPAHKNNTFRKRRFYQISVASYSQAELRIGECIHRIDEFALMLNALNSSKDFSDKPPKRQ
jgi:hypothetical protein